MWKSTYNLRVVGHEKNDEIKLSTPFKPREDVGVTVFWYIYIHILGHAPSPILKFLE